VPPIILSASRGVLDAEGIEEGLVVAARRISITSLGYRKDSQSKEMYKWRGGCGAVSSPTVTYLNPMFKWTHLF